MMVLALHVCVPAFAVYKCESEGRITYGDSPCADDERILDLKTSNIGDPEEASRQSAREKTLLKQLEKQRRKREAVEARERKAGAHANAVKEKKCQTWARSQKRANEDVASSVGKSNEKAKTKARRITEDYEAECGRWADRKLSLR